MTDNNHWQLYSSRTGWPECSARLDAALAAALAKFDAATADNGNIKGAALTAYFDVQAVMDAEENAGYGAGDTEGRSHLTWCIEKHVKTRFPNVQVTL